MIKNYLTLLAIFLSASLSAQVGINTTTPDPSSVLDVTSSDKGVLLPRVVITDSNMKLSPTAPNAISLLVYNLGSPNVPKGFYFWEGAEWKVVAGDASVSPGSVGDVLTTVDADADPAVVRPEVAWRNPEKLNVSPKFFYMPSVVLPTNGVSTEFVTYTDAGTSKYYVVDVFGIFEKQFKTPVLASSATADLSGFVKTRVDYDYFILYADETVFPKDKIKFLEGDESLNAGKFQYEVKQDAIIRNGSFMNIVLRVK